MLARLRTLSLLSILTGVTLAITASATGCAPPASDDDESSSATGEDALTVRNGKDYIVSIEPDLITLRKVVKGSALRFTADDLDGKAVLIHPIEGKTETGVYAHVNSVEEDGPNLVLHTRALGFEEMEATHGDDVIRLYRDSSLTVAPDGPDPDAAFAKSLFLQPSTIPQPQLGGLTPMAFSGPLAGDMTPEVWIGKKRVYGTGQITSSVESARINFKPQAVLDYTRGKGLTVGIRGDFTADLAVRAAGYAEGRVTFFESPTLESPRVTFIVPMGIPPFLVPVPVVLGVDAHVECAALGNVTFDGIFKGHLGLHASASAVVKPSLLHPMKDWVTKGPWPNGVHAEVSFGKTPETTVTGEAGVACIVPRIEFPVTLAGLAGPYIAINPEFALTTGGPSMSIDLYAGAELANEKYFETLLLRWEPGDGSEGAP